jgi:hypothetical protein
MVGPTGDVLTAMSINPTYERADVAAIDNGRRE